MFNTPGLNSVYQYSTSIKDEQLKGISEWNVKVDGLKDRFVCHQESLTIKQDEIHWMSQKEMPSSTKKLQWNALAHSNSPLPCMDSEVHRNMEKT